MDGAALHRTSVASAASAEGLISGELSWQLARQISNLANVGELSESRWKIGHDNLGRSEMAAIQGDGQKWEC